MADELRKGAFDKLVAGLSEDDRTSMLQRISKQGQQTVQFTETPDNISQKNVTLTLRLKKESAFYRFILKLRSLFSRTAVDEIYNSDVIADIARKLNREHAGLINHKLSLLDSIFYERLKTIKEASDFFKPYFSFVNDAPGDFYVFLSSFVTPELSDEINKNADPFSLPFSREPNLETKNEILRKLDAILKDMNTATKAKLYESVTSINWLRQFTRLPFLHFISQFTNIAGATYTCPYKNAIDDFDAFASVFTNIKPIQNEAVQALFLFSQRKELNSKNVQDKDIDHAVQEFISKTNSYFTVIQMFISSVPIMRLGKIINSDFDWQPGNIPGVEAWYPSFRNQWRKIVDVRWNDWVRERKKSFLAQNLKNDFGLDSFPMMDYRPWTGLWGHVKFDCDLTGGFMNWFVNEKFDVMMPILNDVMMEGIFYRNENRSEYSEGLNFFSQACNQMSHLVDKLSPVGEYGQQFDDFINSKLRSLQVQNQIDSMISDTEFSIRDIIKLFGKGCRMMENVFHGFFDDDKDGEHQPLQNLTTIKGRQNREWRDNLIMIRNDLKKVMFYISELEPIDAASTML